MNSVYETVAEVAGQVWALLKEIEASWVTAGVAVAGVLVALRTLRQLRIDSRQRSRPMMAAELRKPPYTEGVQVLVVRNYGPSIARNVKVAFDPPIPDPDPKRSVGGMSPYITRRYAKPICVVTPGMELANIWFVGQPRGDGRVNSEPTPPQFTVTIAYNGPDGTGDYEESFSLDTDLIRAETYVSSSAAPENRLKKIQESLARIATSTGRIAGMIESRKTNE